jgi:hypothetical protein
MTDPTDFRTQVTRDEKARHLFLRLRRQADGYPLDLTLNTVLNLVVDIMAQRHQSGLSARMEFDELMHKARQFLASHYDPTTHAKRHISPFH